MNIRRGIIVITAAALVALFATSAWAVVCNQTTVKNVQELWKSGQLPIKVYVNVARVPEANRTAAVAEIQAALTAWNTVLATCTNLQFQAVVTDNTKFADRENSLSISFCGVTDGGADCSVSGSYYIQTPWKDDDTGEIRYVNIMLNTTTNGWMAGNINTKIINDPKGTQTNYIDIKTLIIRLIPNAVGVFNGEDPNQRTINIIGYNDTDATIKDELKNAVIALYNDTTKTGCATPPTGAVSCKSNTITDCCVKLDHSIPTGTDSGTTPGTGSTAGSGSGTGTGSATGAADESDSGCCRVSHANNQGLPFMALAGLGILLALAIRRRK